MALVDGVATITAIKIQCVPVFSTGDTFQNPETTARTESCIYYVFSYTYIPMIMFNLKFRHLRD